MIYRIGTIVENCTGHYVIEAVDQVQGTFKLSSVRFTKGLGYTPTTGIGSYVSIDTIKRDFEYVAQTKQAWVVDVKESMEGLKQ